MRETSIPAADPESTSLPPGNTIIRVPCLHNAHVCTVLLRLLCIFGVCSVAETNTHSEQLPENEAICSIHATNGGVSAHCVIQNILDYLMVITSWFLSGRGNEIYNLTMLMKHTRGKEKYKRCSESYRGKRNDFYCKDF